MERQITVESIQKMSEEEAQELYKELAVRVFVRFLLLMAFKWALIFATTRALRKYIESNLNQQGKEQ